jgi:hypothetical protein
MEIGMALRRDIRVVPVLVDGALMPRSTDLPDDLKTLVRRNALRISDAGFEDDCRRLVGAIEQVSEKNAAARREREEKKRLEHEPLAQPPSPVAPSTSSAKPEATQSVKTPKVVFPMPPRPAEPCTPLIKMGGSSAERRGRSQVLAKDGTIRWWG